MYTPPKLRSDKVAVIVGRFQVPKLTKGHLHLLHSVDARHNDMLIVVGSSKALPNAHDPLSFEVREMMLRAEFPRAAIRSLANNPSDFEWSRNLDAIIEETFPDREILLYGSRDSFISHYHGRFPYQSVAPIDGVSGTDKRESLRVTPSTAFRAGIIHAHTTRRPIPYPTVDVAILRSDAREVLLASKATDGGLLRFVGGFVDTTDASLEAAAQREVKEETSDIEVSDYRYIGSRIVQDWRYRDTNDRIMTTLFRATYVFGAPLPRDDIVHLEWVPIDQMQSVLTDSHQPLGTMLLASLETDASEPVTPWAL
jgi:bifunctional NMN adenylyltransferase/nudix hydrolase